MPEVSPKDSQTADLVQLSDESNPIEKATESNLEQFSLVELDEPWPTQQTHATHPTHPTQAETSPNNMSTSRLSVISDNESYFSSVSVMSASNQFVPQSDIESEYESEVHSRNYSLDSVSKEQLFELCLKLKERGKKYRNRWAQVVSAYRLINEEKEKMKKVLAETQDKALRRINEMKEQSALEQQAKRHLEENLRVVIEEKDEKIKVLQTKIGLLNEDNGRSTSESSDLIVMDTEEGGDRKELQDKVERLETLLQKCKDSLKSNRDKIIALNRENEELIEFKDKYQSVDKELESLKKLNQDNALSFAEAKQKLHEEIEAKSIVVRELEDQMKKRKHDIEVMETDLKVKSKKVEELEQRIIEIEKTTEDDKQNLIQELSRGKAAAIHLIREETEKKMTALEEEWKQKYHLLDTDNQELRQRISDNESSNPLS